jgi:hypothetical protein
MDHFNINTAGFIIAGLVIVTWLGTVLSWRFGRIEQKWAVRLQGGPGSPLARRCGSSEGEGSVGASVSASPLKDDRRDDASSAPAARQSR